MLPHKAKKNDIIEIKGYLGKQFIVLVRYEETRYGANGAKSEVSYDVIELGKPHSMTLIAYDQDIDKVVATGAQAVQIIKERHGGALPSENGDIPSFFPPAKQSEVSPIESLMQMFEERRKEKEQPKKQKEERAISKYEQERIDHVKKQEYIDYLLDQYMDLSSLQVVLGEEPTRTEEMAIVKAEFYVKSEELYGKRG